MDYIESTNLRIQIHRFARNCCNERRTVGRLDSRFKGVDRDAAGENFGSIPRTATSMAHIRPASATTTLI